ncbi:unnamed protein product, partial [Prunus brigantina]
NYARASLSFSFRSCGCGSAVGAQFSVRVFRAQFCGSILRRDLVAFNAKPYILRFVIRFDFKLLFGCGDFWQS